jgi:exodeoxyribonuclease V alpha subunit
MVERWISPVGCFGPRAWQELLEQAQQVLKELGQEPALAAEAHWVAGLAATAEARRAAFWILLGVLVSESEGHSRLDIDEPAWPEPLAPLLAEATAPWASLRACLHSDELAAIAGSEARPLVLEGRWLSSQRLSVSERRVAALASTRLRGIPGAGAPPEPVLQAPVSLNAEQRRAVALALEAPLALITGRPGTGKTSIVVALLRALQRQAEPVALDRILLAAPTGKAAQRMGEAIRQGLRRIAEPDAFDTALQTEGADPMTLHRALGYHPGTGRFRHDRDNPLPADVVIVDEASMIGLELLESLLQALAPTARLVLLGDADQLPSVDPGAAFRELVAHRPEATARLVESYRMDPRNPKGRHILLQAERVNDPARAAELWGDEGLHRGPLEAAFDQGGVWLVEPQAPKGGWLAAFLERWMEARIWGGSGPQAWRERVLPPLHHDGRREGAAWLPEDLERARALLAHFDGFRLLCPVNEGAELGGVEALNRHLHTLALDTAADRLERQPRFLAGEPVMALANDSSRGLFNGDQGLVLPVKRGEGPPHLEAVFLRGEGLASFPLPSLQDSLDHAYAMTVHKAQGSEFRSIALIMPPAEHPSLTREVLYTALTRAREEVLLLGNAEAVAAACARSVARRSGLGERLENIL